MKTILALMLAALAWGQSDLLQLTANTATLTPGGTATLALNWHNNTGTAVAAQFALTLPADVATASVALNPLVAGKTLSCGPFGAMMKCLIYFGGATPSLAPIIGQTQVAAISITMKPTLTTTSETFGITGQLGADGTPNVNAVTMAAAPPLSITATIPKSRCDLDGDGKTVQADADLAASWANGTTPLPAGMDLNADGAWDVRDVQIVANAVATGTCNAK